LTRNLWFDHEPNQRHGFNLKTSKKQKQKHIKLVKNTKSSKNLAKMDHIPEKTKNKKNIDEHSK
jgi:hypothetical protein